MQGRPSVPLHMLAERAAVFEHALQPAGQAAQALVFDCGRGCRGQRQRPRRQNIALNQQIAKVESTPELCILMEQNAAEFDHVNVSTALRKLLQASRAGMPRGVVEHTLEALEQRALQTMEDFEPQGIANTLHIMAKKRYRPVSAALLPELEGRLRAVAGESTPQNIANTLWAFATLGERPGAGVVGALEERPRAVPPPALALHPLRCLLANPRDCLAVLLRSLFRLA